MQITGPYPSQFFVKNLNTYIVVASNVVKHLDENQILHDPQHGFRSKRNCETQLTILIEEIHRNLKEGKQTEIILLDFRR